MVRKIKGSFSTRTMVLIALLTALVAVLQLLGAFVRLGPFSISLVLIPIVIGAAACGALSGGWLGLVFGVAVLLSGDASAFLVIDPMGTVITVLSKGIFAGLAAGIIYKLFENKSRYLATTLAALVCPIVNTGIFLLGCFIFFLPAVSEWGLALGFESTLSYMIFGLVGGNFIFELLVNILLSPMLLRLLQIKDRYFKG